MRIKRLFPSLLAILTLAPASGIAAPASLSGVYGSLTLGLDPQSQELTGYYQNGTGLDAEGKGPQFNCTFFLRGKKSGDSYKVQTWFPGDPAATKISGQLKADGAAIVLKLSELPGGCAMVDPDLAKPEGETMPQDSPGTWTGVRVISAKRAHFYESPNAPAPRKTYVVRGDGVRVWEKKPGWVMVDYEGRNKGWMKAEDLFPDSL